MDYGEKLAKYSQGVGQSLGQLLAEKGVYQSVTLDVPEGLDLEERLLLPVALGDRAAGAPGYTDFRLPSLQLPCLRCKCTTTFQSQSPGYERNVMEQHAPVEQLFTWWYECASCSAYAIHFSVFRRGTKLQLTGRTARYVAPVSPLWPKDVRKIVEDAESATAENDVAAGYYHLRTALEFMMKTGTKTLIDAKVDGVELCDQYNKTLDERMSSAPSLKPIYTELSSGLHTRKVDDERFRELVGLVEDHLQFKSMFAKHGPAK